MNQLERKLIIKFWEWEKELKNWNKEYAKGNYHSKLIDIAIEIENLNPGLKNKANVILKMENCDIEIPHWELLLDQTFSLLKKEELTIYHDNKYIESNILDEKLQKLTKKIEDCLKNNNTKEYNYLKIDYQNLLKKRQQTSYELQLLYIISNNNKWLKKKE